MGHARLGADRLAVRHRDPLAAACREVGLDESLIGALGRPEADGSPKLPMWATAAPVAVSTTSPVISCVAPLTEARLSTR